MHAKQAKETAINSELSEKLDTKVVAALEAWGYQVKMGQSRTCHYIYWVTA